MEKRCYNIGEALTYLGVKRRSFEVHILPQIRHKAIRIGTSVVFERSDLDMAWDRYKINAGSGNVRSGEKGGQWSVRRMSGYSPTAIMDISSTDDTSVSAFDSAASRLLQRQKRG